MLRITLFILCCLFGLHALAQQGRFGVIADAGTRQSLPFATVRLDNTKQGFITDINGRFSFNLVKDAKQIQVSYTGYETKTFTPARDTFFLSPLVTTMGEVVVKPPYDKIRRIVNTAINNKDRHDPDNYDWYRCDIYYKLNAGYVPDLKLAQTDPDIKDIAEFSQNSYIILNENYTRRTYRRPKQIQEEILASRLSGFKNTTFTTLVTDVLPFDIYGDFIRLNEKDYLHPISKGWQGRYEFDIVDELLDGTDTVFILKYRPKRGVSFNSLKGIVYINTNGYAISHIIANTDDTAAGRYVKMEQVYQHVEGKWFPRELNYDFVFKKYPSEEIGMLWTGHSLIDSVSFTEDEKFKFDKAHPVKLHDSVVLRTPEQWQAYRFDSLSGKEKNTYQLMDSVVGEMNAEGFLAAAGKAATQGLLPVGPVDFDVKRILSFNTYEGTRLGLGAYTNERISKYFAVGGWFGYGFRDKVMKYGANARIYPNGTREHWLDAFYQKNNQSTGSINFHRELDKNTLRQWVLAQVDMVEEYGATVHTRAGYWEIEAQGKKQTLTPQYSYTFSKPGSNMRFDVKEGSIGIRYAFAEKRKPVFGYYVPQTNTKYPIVYLRLSGGAISSGSYETEYYRALAAITYQAHINRWGTDKFRLEGGLIKTLDDKALPRSFLLGGNGFRTNGKAQWYGWGGFVTLFPYSFFSDRYASLVYMHDFDKRLFKHKYSNPYLSVAHNMLWGDLSANNKLYNPGIETPSAIYHESGIVLNQLFRFDFSNIAYLNFNLGGFYHWTPNFDWEKNGRITLGISLDL